MAKQKVTRSVEKGKVYITATFNNTVVTVTDEQGNTLAWQSAGTVGFKNARKSTPFAATRAGEQALRRATNDFGMREVAVFIKGPGSGRDAVLRALKSTGIKISQISDVTAIPHNGVRPKKRRRV